MALLSDERDQRLLDPTGSRMGTEERMARFTGGRYANTPDDPHYNEKYGTTLSNSQLAAVDKNQQDFTSSIINAKGEWETANTKLLGATQEWEKSKADVESQYGTGLSAIETARAGLPINYDTWKESLGGTGYSTWQEGGYWNGEEGGLNTKWTEGTPRPARTKMDDYYEQAYNVSMQSDVDSVTGGSSGQYLNQGVFDQRMDQLLKDDYIANLKQNTGFSTFYNKWVSENTVPVVINDTRGFNKTYYVDPATGAKIGSTDLGGYGSAGGNATNGYYVYSDTYAGNFIEPLDNYERNTALQLGQVYTSKMPEELERNRVTLDTQYQTAQSDLRTYENQLKSSQETLSSRQAEITSKEAENLAALGSIRTKYANKLKSMSDTIGSLTYG